MKTYKKLVLSLLVLVLVVSLVPTAAMAANISTTHTISIEKKLQGDTPASQETFTFKLEAKDGAPLPGSTTVTVTGAGTASFGAVEYTVPADYVYTVSEVQGSTANYTYDKTVYTVLVQVTTDNAGKLTATQYVEKADGKPADGKITFTNTYTKPTTGGGGGSSSTASPKTNDVTNDTLLAKIIAVSGAGMLVFLFYWNGRRKQEKE